MPSRVPDISPVESVGIAAASDLLAASLLRFQRLQPQEEDRKAAIHASQSGEAWAGGIAGAMAVEQLSILSVWRKRAVEDWGRVIESPPFALSA